MKVSRFIRFVMSAGTAALLHISVTAAETKGKPDYEEVARKLVTQTAAIKKGDIVRITGNPRDLELLEDIAVNVRKQGAFPLLTIITDRLSRRLYTDIPASLDAQTPDLEVSLANMIDAWIVVGDPTEDPGLLADIPAERTVTRATALLPETQALLKRNVRSVVLGNGLYPTSATARNHGLSRDELSRLFWDGVNVDYAAMQATGQKVRTALTDGREVHVTNPNGTDLRFRIDARPVGVGDGVMTTEKQQKGGSAVIFFLPAGEVYVTPVPGTAEGTVIVDRLPYENKIIEGLTLTFGKGKMTSMTAKSGIERLKENYDAASEGRDEFGFVDIGINPNVRIPKGSRLVSYVPAGMVTVGVGANLWAGGENTVRFSIDAFLPGSTLTVDGKTVVENGALKL